MHCLNKDWRSRYLLCLDIGQTFLWMKRRSINYKIKNTCSHAWLLHEYTFDWKGKHLPLIPWIEWLCSQLNTFVVILSEGLPHIICCEILPRGGGTQWKGGYGDVRPRWGAFLALQVFQWPLFILKQGFNIGCISTMGFVLGVLFTTGFYIGCKKLSF